MADSFVCNENGEYNFHLDDFDGPLDLLLHLVKEAKIDIKNIFVSKITEQYLKYMEGIDSIDAEKASDFIEMAAWLLEIKSKQLLPKVADEIVDDDDPEQKLIARLEEYKLYKEQSEKLHKIENVDRFFKKPEPYVGDVRYVLGNINFQALLDSFSRLLYRVSERAEIPAPKKIQKEKFSVAYKIAQIKDSLLEKKRVKFSDLFLDAGDRGEVINTFLALLELLKDQTVKAMQDDAFSEIYICSNDEVGCYD